MASEMTAFDKQMIEAIRLRVEQVRDAKRPSHWSTTYGNDVGFLLDRIDELTAGVVAAPVEDATNGE